LYEGHWKNNQLNGRGGDKYLLVEMFMKESGKTINCMELENTFIKTVICTMDL
jgi:hypothetical protein